ncbi:hypothetical protein GGP41_000070 [Bipolaris sorokiniana]|uniref:Uncharacterized protein n=1 Tax=Cochliobolus sativus TaxID=45130 RepID=A0A8H5ZES1_COCSA|nr:hypothetical protein GGP41_000070 [Bipolaris sorokiniana]
MYCVMEKEVFILRRCEGRLGLLGLSRVKWGLRGGGAGRKYRDGRANQVVGWVGRLEPKRK